MHKHALPAIFALAAGLFLPSTETPAHAQGLIRDAEIENTIGRWAEPLVRHAGFQKGEIRFHLVRDPRINAFVTGGKRIFLTTGLLTASTHPGQVMGVIAHEIGHITGGHLARQSGAREDSRILGAVGTLVGIAAGAAAGRLDVALASPLLGADLQRRSVLKFTRVQERSADQVAVELLDKAEISSQGMLELMTILESQELLPADRQDPYVRSHPLTRNRIAFVRNHLAGSPVSDSPLAAGELIAHGRMTAKLKGFLNRPAVTLREFGPQAVTVRARYARAIALYRSARIDQALALVDGLISEAPDDPYYRELRGQILFENGRLAEAREDYERALRLLPGQPLLLISLAHVYIEMGGPDVTERAARILQRAIVQDPRIPSAWRLSAIAYGRAKRFGLSALASAEHALLVGRRGEAALYARKAVRLLPEGAPPHLRARDIVSRLDPASVEKENGQPGSDRQSAPPKR